VGATDNDAAASVVASVAADKDSFQEICLPPPTNVGD
jgi:hypothetical protein